jgi:hypothetical protein
MSAQAIPGTDRRAVLTLTYVSGHGVRLYYASRIPASPGEQAAGEFPVPAAVQARLDRINARLAWMYLGTPKPRSLAGPAAARAAPVTSPGRIGRLTIASSPRSSAACGRARQTFAR